MEPEAAELEELYPRLRQLIAEGLAQARTGQLVDGEQFFDDLEAEDPGEETHVDGSD
jgi:hypothetical protein